MKEILLAVMAFLDMPPLSARADWPAVHPQTPERKEPAVHRSVDLPDQNGPTRRGRAGPHRLMDYLAFSCGAACDDGVMHATFVVDESVH